MSIVSHLPTVRKSELLVTLFCPFNWLAVSPNFNIYKQILLPYDMFTIHY